MEFFERLWTGEIYRKAQVLDGGGERRLPSGRERSAQEISYLSTKISRRQESVAALDRRATSPTKTPLVIERTK